MRRTLGCCRNPGFWITEGSAASVREGISAGAAEAKPARSGNYACLRKDAPRPAGWERLVGRSEQTKGACEWPR